MTKWCWKKLPFIIESRTVIHAVMAEVVKHAVAMEEREDALMAAP